MRSSAKRSQLGVCPASRSSSWRRCSSWSQIPWSSNSASWCAHGKRAHGLGVVPRQPTVVVESLARCWSSCATDWRAPRRHDEKMSSRWSLRPASTGERSVSSRPKVRVVASSLACPLAGGGRGCHVRVLPCPDGRATHHTSEAPARAEAVERVPGHARDSVDASCISSFWCKSDCDRGRYCAWTFVQFRWCGMQLSRDWSQQFARVEQRQGLSASHRPASARCSANSRCRCCRSVRVSGVVSISSSP